MSRMEFLEQNVGFDYIIEAHETKRFTEFITSTGGDVVRYRVYGNTDEDYSVTAK